MVVVRIVVVVLARAAATVAIRLVTLLVVVVVLDLVAVVAALACFRNHDPRFSTTRIANTFESGSRVVNGFESALHALHLHGPHVYLDLDMLRLTFGRVGRSPRGLLPLAGSSLSLQSTATC